MKGQLAYKDSNGHVWNILEDGFGAYGAIDSDDLVIARAEFISELIDQIDELVTPEWTNQKPSEPVQKDALDRRAFPDDVPKLEGDYGHHLREDCPNTGNCVLHAVT